MGRRVALLPRLAAVMAAALGLGACQTVPTLQTSSDAPPKPQSLCPPEVVAPTPTEPQPPRGVDAAKLYAYLSTTFGEGVAQAWWEWLTTTYPGWGHAMADRLDKARSTCTAQGS